MTRRCAFLGTLLCAWATTACGGRDERPPSDGGGAAATAAGPDAQPSAAAAAAEPTRRGLRAGSDTSDAVPMHEPGDPDLMIPVSGTPEPSPAAIEIDPDQLLPRHLPISDEARDEIVELVRAMQPLKESLTSDHHDRHFILNKRRLERLRQDEREDVGWAALHAFTNYPGEHTDIRRELLSVGAHVSPKEAAPLLSGLAFTYGFRLADRAEALLLLGKVDPDAVFESARPYLERKGRPFQTAPDDEFFLRAWLDACEASGTSPAPMLAQVATNFALSDIARHTAIHRLRDHTDNPYARGALETVLVESTGNGYIRVKAGQSIIAGYSREEACVQLEKVARKESDPNFARFLDDLIQENCR